MFFIACACAFAQRQETGMMTFPQRSLLLSCFQHV